MDKQSKELTESSPSDSSLSSSSQAFSRDPTRLLAVLGAIGLRAWGKLDSIETVIVLASAVGAPITTAIFQLFRRMLGR